MAFPEKAGSIAMPSLRDEAFEDLHFKPFTERDPYNRV
jgi:hypothetical protein